MKKIILLIIVLTLGSCNNHNEVKYVNKEYSIEVRLDDLMSRMTLEEKVAQMTQFVGLNYITDADRNMTAEEIAKKALKVASEICVFTNNNITIEKV